MAHIISLPAQFEFNIWPMEWFPAKLKLDRWKSRAIRRGQRKEWDLLASVLEPSQFAGHQYAIRRGAIPNDVWRKIPPKRGLLPVALRAFEFEAFLYLPRDEGEQTRSVDPWQVRDEFLALRSTPALLAFLNKHGTWDEWLRPMWFFLPGWRQNPRLAYPADFWIEQGKLRRALTHGVRDWPSSKIDFAWAPDFPHYRHADNDCLRAIKTATTIDFLRNVHFKICAREDCGKPFPADRRGKQYCQQYCAHLVSVRKKRKQQAQEKPKSKNNPD